jgi:integrase
VTGAAAAPSARPPRPVFAGADVCALAGLNLPAGAARPVFEDQVWDFTEVTGLRVQMQPASRRFDFTVIINPRWQMVARELVLALLAPRHEAVAPLPRAYRAPLHLGTARGRLSELTRWLNWLTGRGITSLGEVDDHCCQAYLAQRRQVLDERGTVIGDCSPATRRAAAQVVVDLLSYGELFTADRLDPRLRPWGGASASAVAEVRCGRDGNKTPPVDDTVLQPMLAAALYMVTTLGPHVAALHQQIRHAGTARPRGPRPPGPRARPKNPAAALAAVLDRHRRTGEPLPELDDASSRARIARGWDASDPLLALNLDAIARQAGFMQFEARWLPPLRSDILAALRAAGTDRSWARAAASVPRADGQGSLPWTAPMHRFEADALIGITRTAVIILTAAVSGMRSSELMELRAGCRRPAEEYAPGLVRYRLASKVVKGQPPGGTADEWVVIEPAFQAIGLAEQLHHDPRDGALLFGRFAFAVRYRWFRDWVNGPAGQRLGLAAIPDGDVTLRMLRRTLAIELAYRPGGVLATKIHLKHVSVATTEGYAARPGGAQAELLAEVNKHEAEHKLEVVLQEYRNYQAGILPSGPGASGLTEFFARIDGAVTDGADAPQVQRSDRDILNLLSRRAATLHLGIANYCWFADPSQALCLKLAGTPDAATPLAGMCDSARCPQATHHAVHRDTWAGHAESTKTFLGSLGPTRKTERARLQGDLDRALAVIAGIDAAARPAPGAADEQEEPCG